jgi:hypothetical protein
MLRARVRQFGSRRGYGDYGLAGGRCYVARFALDFCIGTHSGSVAAGSLVGMCNSGGAAVFVVGWVERKTIRLTVAKAECIAGYGINVSTGGCDKNVHVFVGA